MFNPMSSEQVITAVGGVLRQAADSDERLDDYQRSQLLSAYSVTRQLAAGEAGAARLLAWLRAELLTSLGDEHPRTRERIADAHDGRDVGDAVAELLTELRRDEPDGPLRARLQRLLGELADREVAILAEGQSR